MTRPEQGTPEYDLWIAAIEVAVSPPFKRGGSASLAGVYWPRIDALRAALEALGIDWQAVKREAEGTS